MHGPTRPPSSDSTGAYSQLGPAVCFTATDDRLLVTSRAASQAGAAPLVKVVDDGSPYSVNPSMHAASLPSPAAPPDAPGPEADDSFDPFAFPSHRRVPDAHAPAARASAALLGPAARRARPPSSVTNVTDSLRDSCTSPQSLYATNTWDWSPRAGGAGPPADPHRWTSPALPVTHADDPLMYPFAFLEADHFADASPGPTEAHQGHKRPFSPLPGGEGHPHPLHRASQTQAGPPSSGAASYQHGGNGGFAATGRPPPCYAPLGAYGGDARLRPRASAPVPNTAPTPSAGLFDEAFRQGHWKPHDAQTDCFVSLDAIAQDAVGMSQAGFAGAAYPPSSSTQMLPTFQQDLFADFPTHPQAQQHSMTLQQQHQQQQRQQFESMQRQVHQRQQQQRDEQRRRNELELLNLDQVLQGVTAAPDWITPPAAHMHDGPPSLDARASQSHGSNGCLQQPAFGDPRGRAADALAPDDRRHTVQLADPLDAGTPGAGLQRSGSAADVTRWQSAAAPRTGCWYSAAVPPTSRAGAARPFQARGRQRPATYHGVDAISPRTQRQVDAVIADRTVRGGTALRLLAAGPIADATARPSDPFRPAVLRAGPGPPRGRGSNKNLSEMVLAAETRRPSNPAGTFWAADTSVHSSKRKRGATWAGEATDHSTRGGRSLHTRLTGQLQTVDLSDEKAVGGSHSSRSRRGVAKDVEGGRLEERSMESWVASIAADECQGNRAAEQALLQDFLAWEELSKAAPNGKWRGANSRKWGKVGIEVRLTGNVPATDGPVTALGAMICRFVDIVKPRNAGSSAQNGLTVSEVTAISSGDEGVADQLLHLQQQQQHQKAQQAPLGGGGEGGDTTLAQLAEEAQQAEARLHGTSLQLTADSPTPGTATAPGVCSDTSLSDQWASKNYVWKLCNVNGKAGEPGKVILKEKVWLGTYHTPINAAVHHDFFKLVLAAEGCIYTSDEVPTCQPPAGKKKAHRLKLNFPIDALPELMFKAVKYSQLWNKHKHEAERYIFRNFPPDKVRAMVQELISSHCVQLRNYIATNDAEGTATQVERRSSRRRSSISRLGLDADGNVLDDAAP